MAQIRDPQTMRALAHPLRMRLIEVIGSEGTATATRCAEIVGGSASNCSFHLRNLAKYGFIERAPGSGRERPWRLTSVSQVIDADPDNPEAVIAARAFDEMMLNWEFTRLRDANRRGTDPDPAWARTMALAGATMWLLPDEARELSHELGRLSMRYMERAEDPALRPSGSRAVRLFLASSLITDLDPPTPPAPAGPGAAFTEEGQS